MIADGGQILVVQPPVFTQLSDWRQPAFRSSSPAACTKSGTVNDSSSATAAKTSRTYIATCQLLSYKTRITLFVAAPSTVPGLCAVQSLSS